LVLRLSSVCHTCNSVCQFV